MANTRQAKKRILVNARKRSRSMMVRSAVKTSLKKTVVAAEKNDAATSELLHDAIRKIDKAATKGIMHKNTAARKKSRLMKRVNRLTAEAAE